MTFKERRREAYLDVVALVVVATLSEESMADHAVNVEHVENRVGVLQRQATDRVSAEQFGSEWGTETHLRQRSGEDDDLVDLAHPLQKVVDSRSLDDVDVVRLAFDLDRDDVVGLGDELLTTERGVRQLLSLRPQEEGRLRGRMMNEP